ncbi:cupin domain-containing protein [Microbulbifer sp. SA54]|uniref:cupin domain-containing protein n=1 Tax=Microbulbifer sp. SA54 TaxID=3401577 RepID=UPI003AAB1EC6
MPNLFSDLPSALAGEVFSHIAGGKHVKIERIVSRGQATPEGQWYDQDMHEWVLVLQGAARLVFEDGRELTLKVGDHVNIPAHCRHRVSWTAPAELTVWLAVFYE